LKAEGKSPDAYQVTKQADALLPFYTLGIEEVNNILQELGYIMPKDYVKRNYDYYLQRTSHGSTLSRVVHAYLANLIGDKELAWTLYMESLESDYVDIQGGTTGEGIHTGVMGGTIILTLSSFGGITFFTDILQVNPELPGLWKNIHFSCSFQNNDYVFNIQNDKVRIYLHSSESESVHIRIKNVTKQLQPNSWNEFTIT